MQSSSRNPDETIPTGVSVRSLLGGVATDPDGRVIGEITDVVIEPHRGVVAFVILRHRDDHDDHDPPKRFAIPMAGCQLTESGAVINIDPRTLHRSPGRW